MEQEATMVEQIVDKDDKVECKRAQRKKVAVNEVVSNGAVTYFNKFTMTVGVRVGKNGYQVAAKKTYRIGDRVVVRVKDGAVTIE